MRGMILFLALTASQAVGGTLTVLDPVRAGEILQPDDLTFGRTEAVDGFDDPRALVGLEARVNLYPGRPIRTAEVGRPTVVARNAVVPLIFRRGGLTITLEGRALGDAGEGEDVRVMNLSSRSTVHGVATASGAVIVN